MENQDKLHEQFRQSAQKAEEKGFDRMEAVWNRVEEKLDRKKERRAAAWWKYTGVAAVLLLFVTVGTFLYRNNDVMPHAPRNARPENNVTVIDTQKVKEAVSPDANKEAVAIEEAHPVQQGGTQPNTHKAPTFVAEPSVGADYAAAETGDAKVAESVSSPTQPYTNHNNAAATTTGNIVVFTAPATNPDTSMMLKKIPVDTKALLNGMYRGTVIDNAGLPLPGVTVVVKDTKTRTSTDFDGKFSINAKPGDIIEVAMVGMESQNLILGSAKDISIALQDNTSTLEEVVVVGYGTHRRASRPSKKEERKAKEAVAASTMINSASNMAMANVANSRIMTPVTQNRYPVQNSIQVGSGTVTEKSQDKSQPSLSETLQSEVAGVAITSAGAPGTSNAIAIRGAASVRQGSEPLVVIDGVVRNNKELQSLDPASIVAVNVLKDAAATAIYGSRGSNGVIIINTKNGLTKKQLRKLQRLNKKLEKKNISLTPTTAQALPQPTEEAYETFEENKFENPALAPLSTFSIDVDNASYTNIRRFLNNGQVVPKDAVRVEEMVNFFKYSYPQPAGDAPFSINTEYGSAPWNPKHKLLKIGLQGKIIPQDKLPASNFVFLIDVSGSMNDANKLPLLKQSMKLLVAQMRKEDRVAIVVYAGAAGVVLPPTRGDQKDNITNALDKLSAGGSTAGGQGIELAYKLAGENFIKGGNNRVILATDGDFNVGVSTVKDVQSLIEEKRKSGIFLTCLGYGMGNYKDNMLETLSDKGNGNYAYIDTMQEADRFLQKEFTGSMYAIAKDVKIQIEFNPAQVKAYRLIGYENRKLRDEDFANDAIDAGELGSGHTVTALYEIIPTGVKSDYFKAAPDLKYSTAQNTGQIYNNELATIKFRHKKPDSNVSNEMVYTIPNSTLAPAQASADFRFAAAVAWFGLKLRDSKLVPDKATEHIVKLAKEGLANDPDGYRSEFIRLAQMVE